MSSLKSLYGEVERFIAGPKKNAGFDLSQLSILRSEQIGVLVKAVRGAENKHGRIIVLASNHALLEILRAIDLDKKAVIVQNAQAFKAALEEQDPCTPSSSFVPSATQIKPGSIKSTDPVAPLHSTSVPSTDKRARLGLFVISGLLLLFLLTALLIFFLQYRANAVITQQTLETKTRLECQVDSLSLIINQYREEEKLLKEIGLDGRTKGASHDGKK